MFSSFSSCFGNHCEFVNYDELHEDALVPDTKLVVRNNKSGRETTGKILLGTFGPNDFKIYLNDDKKK